MSNPLNPDALEAAKRTFALTNPSRLCAYEDLTEKRQQQIDSQISQTIEAYLAAARRWLTTSEELEALRAGSIVRSKRGIVRERFSTGWLAVGGDGIATSEHLAMIEGGHELLHDGEADA